MEHPWMTFFIAIAIADSVGMWFRYKRVTKVRVDKR